MYNPLVSVVIPTHGGAAFLTRAIDSVLAQTYKNIEIIVVDDNGLGTEGQRVTETIIKQYLDNPRFQYVTHEVNMNGSVARNTGARHAKGKYISLLDDDDYFLPDNIENHMNAWEQLDDTYGLTTCDVELHYPNGSIVVKHKTIRGQDLYALLMHKIVIGSGSMVVSKKAWEELNGFDESFKRHQDFEFSARVMAKYKVWATKTVGECCIRVGRHSPKNIPLAIEYRQHYIEKMKPLMSSLSYIQKKKVIAWNMGEAAWPYFKNKQLVGFFKVMANNHVLLWTLWVIYRRIFKVKGLQKSCLVYLKSSTNANL